MKAAKQKIQDSILFLGNREDTYRLYQAMDVFVFPSRYEGLGMSAVEAQLCGVRTVVSDRVPSDANISDNILGLSLNVSAKHWAKKILQRIPTHKTKYCRYAKYDISKESIKLTQYYTEIACALE